MISCVPSVHFVCASSVALPDLGDASTVSLGLGAGQPGLACVLGDRLVSVIYVELQVPVRVSAARTMKVTAAPMFLSITTRQHVRQADTHRQLL